MLARQNDPSYLDAARPFAAMLACLGYVAYFSQVNGYIGPLDGGDLDRTVVGLLVAAGVLGVVAGAFAVRAYSFHAKVAIEQRSGDLPPNEQRAWDDANPQADEIVKRYLANRAAEPAVPKSGERRQVGSKPPAGQVDRRRPEGFGRRR